jgi:hypothetical protein
MTIPIPSQIRTVRLDLGGQHLSRGITPVVPLFWPSKHPLDNAEPWWIDATRWLTDPAGVTPWDTIGQVATPITLPDSALRINRTVISADGMQAGVYFSGGTPGAKPVIRVVLTGTATGIQRGLDIVLPIENVAPVQANPPGDTTLHRSVVTIGGLRFPIPS